MGTRTGTNYSEIQSDEIEALRSIYMADFEEEKAIVGAWNKIGNRAFRLTLKSTLHQEDDVALVLSVSLPPTYPKTIPKLSLTFRDGVHPKSRTEAEELIRGKPVSLLGSEMIFEIATLLQETLDQAVQTNAQNIPTLDEERFNQQRAISQKVQQLEQERHREKSKADVEEEDYLTEMVSQYRKREEKRQKKQDAKFKQDEKDRKMTEPVHFDPAIEVTDPKGNEVEVHAVSEKVLVGQGPVTEVWSVRHDRAPASIPNFLLLKECCIPVLTDMDLATKEIQSLETKFSELIRLPPHPNIANPLAFRIRSAQMLEGSKGDGWDVSILMELAEKGSLHDMLECISNVVAVDGRAWAIQLVEGLVYYHRHQLSHGSVHVSNVVLRKAKTKGILLKLSDGIYQQELYKLSGRKRKSHAELNPAYWTAPEVADGNIASAVAATDLWDLGVVLIQMFFGLEILSDYSTPTAFLADYEILPSVERLLRAMLHPNPQKRPSAWDLLQFTFLRNEDSIRGIAAESLGSKRRSANSRLAADFAQEGVLGRGGYGKVVRARHRLDATYYAIKILYKCSESMLDKLIPEVTILSQLQHPHVVRYVNVWKEAETPYPNGLDESRSNGTLSTSEDSDISHSKDAKESGGLDFVDSTGEKRYSDEISSEADEASEDDGVVFGEDSEDDVRGTYEDDMNEKERQIEHKMELEAARLASRARREPDRQHQSSDTTLCIQMEYCEGKTLRELIDSGLPDNEEEIWHYLRQMLSGLVHIHNASIVHRDLKPENIFIDHKNNVRIGDFGLARPGDLEQPLAKATDPEQLSTKFTRSIGTALYVAPEVRSASTSKGNYDQKADMYSLGIILFEMSYRIETGMERVQVLSALRREEPKLPAAFIKDPEKSDLAQIITSLVDHDPNNRPNSFDLLHNSLQVPLYDEEEAWRAALRLVHRQDLRAELFCNTVANTFQEKRSGRRNRAALLKDFAFDLDPWPKWTDKMSLIRTSIKDHLTSIFRHHGALQVNRPLVIPLSDHYSKMSKTAYPIMDEEGEFYHFPYDLTLPNARVLAKHYTCGPKTFCFGDVYRKNSSGGHPKTVGEVDFDIISYIEGNSAIAEAEVMKVLDEIINEFPSLATVQMCFHMNHSRILDAVMEACGIALTKRQPVMEVLSRLHTGDSTWNKIKSELRAPPVMLLTHSLERISHFDFRDTCDDAIVRLRTMVKISPEVEEAFAHLKAVDGFLAGFNITHKVYISPLSCYNANFYRDNILFQCVYDSKTKKNVFAAGGRYDQLIQEYRLLQNAQSLERIRVQVEQDEDDDLPPSGPNIPLAHAVGFNLSWQDLHKSMIRYHKKNMKRGMRDKDEDDSRSEWSTFHRCDVLVDSFDPSILFIAGPGVIQELWAHGVHAELAVHRNPMTHSPQSGVYGVAEDAGPYTYVIYIKEGLLKIRNVVKHEEIELRASGLSMWCKTELGLSRLSSPGEQGIFNIDNIQNLEILTPLNNRKKPNAKNIKDEVLSRIKNFGDGLKDGSVRFIAVDIKDEQLFEGIGDTRLSDPDSWKKLIQGTNADDRPYLQQIYDGLKQTARKAVPGFRNVFLYNIRNSSSMWYDLGRKG